MIAKFIINLTIIFSIIIWPANNINALIYNYDDKMNILFVSLENSIQKINVWSLTERKSTEIYQAQKGEDIIHPSFCFENRMLLFVKNDLHGENGEIILLNLENHGDRIIYHQNVSIRGLCLSPDEKLVAFLSDFDPNSEACSLYLLNLETKKVDKLISANVKGIGNNYKVSWLPNSQNIAFSDVNGYINIINVKTKQIDKLEKGYDPQLSANGKKILCVRKNFFTGLVPTIYNLDSDQEEKVIISRVLNAIWSPNDKKLIIVRNDSNIFKWKDLNEHHCEIILYDINTKEKRTLFYYKGYNDIDCR